MTLWFHDEETDKKLSSLHPRYRHYSHILLVLLDRSRRWTTLKTHFCRTLTQKNKGRIGTRNKKWWTCCEWKRALPNSCIAATENLLTMNDANDEFWWWLWEWIAVGIRRKDMTLLVIKVSAFIVTLILYLKSDGSIWHFAARQRHPQ